MLTNLARGDTGAIRRAMVTPGRLGQTLSCGGRESVIARLEAALNEIDKLSNVTKRMSIEVVSLTETGRRTVAKGDHFRDCTANESFEVRMLELRKRVAIGEVVDTSQETINVVRLDGAWYLMLNE